MEAMYLPLANWSLAIRLLRQAKAVLSAQGLKGQLGRRYSPAWRTHHKLITAMAEREEGDVLRGKVQTDDADLGRERCGGMAEHGSGNKIPFVATVSLTEDQRPSDQRPSRAKLIPMPGFTFRGVMDCSRTHTAASCDHQPTAVGGRKPKCLPEIQWINILLGYLKISLSGAFHPFAFSN